MIGFNPITESAVHMFIKIIGQRSSHTDTWAGYTENLIQSDYNIMIINIIKPNTSGSIVLWHVRLFIGLGAQVFYTVLQARM